MSNSEDCLRLDNQLCFAIYACSKEIIRLYRPFLEKFGITYTQYLVLMVLWETSPLPFKELSQRLYLDSGTLTPLLKKMEKQGLVTRERLAEDERQLLLKLTKKGCQLKQEAYCVPEQMICRTQIIPEEAATLRNALHRLLAKLPQN